MRTRTLATIGTKTLLAILVTFFMIGCGGTTLRLQPVSVRDVPAPPPGMQRFEGISDERVQSEWNAYQQAWSRAMERISQFISTRVRSEILEWNRQSTRETLKKRIVDIHTLFESTTRITTTVSLKQVYEIQQQRRQNRDGTWKARVILVAPVDELLADARQAEAELQSELQMAQHDAERTVRMHKQQLRHEWQRIEEATTLPQRLAFLKRAFPLYAELQSARKSIQRARQLKASRDGVEALRTYRLVQTVGGDAPEDGMPIPDVPHAYHQTWESLNTAIDQLRRAQQEFDDKNFEVAQRLLTSYQRQMGDATGPFVNTLTGHVTQVQVSPASLRQQIEERLRVPIISLAFASSDLTERQLDRFRKQIADGLRQNGYTVTINNNESGLKVRGELKVIKADVGTLVTINLTATLTFSNQKRVDKIRVHTGPQISTSEDEALHTAIQLSLTKCAAVVEEWVEKVRS